MAERLKMQFNSQNSIANGNDKMEVELLEDYVVKKVF